ncbi:MAG: hypothetical protein ACI87H_002300, partial [Gammaproteobacteria bacterium]
MTVNNGTYLSSDTRYKNPAMSGQSVKHFANASAATPPVVYCAKS